MAARRACTGSSAREFQACHAALAAAGVRIPALYALDFSQQHYPAGLALVEDIRGGSLEDLQWEHAFLRLTFGQADYARLGLSPVDEARVAFYDLAQRTSLVEGPLRIAATDYPERDWMLEFAQFHTDSLLAEVQRAPRGRRTLA